MFDKRKYALYNKGVKNFKTRLYIGTKRESMDGGNRLGKYINIT